MLLIMLMAKKLPEHFTKMNVKKQVKMSLEYNNSFDSWKKRHSINE